MLHATRFNPVIRPETAGKQFVSLRPYGRVRRRSD